MPIQVETRDAAALDDADLETTLRVLDHLRDAATRAMASQVQA